MVSGWGGRLLDGRERKDLYKWEYNDGSFAIIIKIILNYNPPPNCPSRFPCWPVLEPTTRITRKAKRIPKRGGYCFVCGTWIEFLVVRWLNISLNGFLEMRKGFFCSFVPVPLLLPARSQLGSTGSGWGFPKRHLNVKQNINVEFLLLVLSCSCNLQA